MATPIMRILGLLRQAQKRGKSSRAPYKCVIKNDYICMSCYGHVIFQSSIPLDIKSMNISATSQMEFDAVNTLFYFLNLPYYCTNKYESNAILRSNGVFVYVREDA